ncbi:putative teichuronic acid biosynthesis glycosyltransferase TuaC [Rubripirellula tenax]|uniref:Putative teichuronic acid biosynthesis glycosyltransferase TuaC n=1 Tax=Rubripirellula tenax TaxID=2528015 RepID=A0A5C6EZM7_9BACT|nr:glycosyltransferase [Rubripirellula tenax]TWU54492.1 putative teichuronic acid biosynthesis glycosyltransferase TuaC [Rubripirellula tenax]
MNVLSVCTNLPTQRSPLHGLFVRRRLEELAKLLPVRALAPQPWFPLVRPRRIDPAISTANLTVDAASMLYFPGVAKGLDGFWLDRCVDRWLDEMDPDVVGDAILDAHFGYPEGVGCWRVAKRRGMPIFITIRGLEVDLFGRSSRGDQLLQALCEATGVIAVSHSLKKVAVSAGVPADQITVIPNGVDTATYSMGDQTTARRQVGYESPKKLIVSVGNLKPVKGHDVLIRAVARIKNDVDFQLVCIGGGVQSTWGKSLQNLVSELGVQDHVRFIGSKPPHEVADWLRAADLFALASHREGCCNAVLEALSTGLPVVATDAGDNAEYIKDSNMGCVVPTKSPADLGKAIVESLSNQYDKASIANAMVDTTWSSVAGKIVGLLNQLPNRRPIASVPENADCVP